MNYIISKIDKSKLVSINKEKVKYNIDPNTLLCYEYLCNHLDKSIDCNAICKKNYGFLSELAMR
jgi:hypothetical protein